MEGFAEWLLLEELGLIDPSVLNSYEQEFQRQVSALAARTHNPDLRRAIENMHTCPVRNRNGRCSRFVDYIVGALVRHGCHQQYDIEDSLQRIAFRMLSPVGERGNRKRTVFDFDETRPYDLRIGNPIEVIFKTYLMHELRSVCGGKIPALRKVQRPGTVSIGYGDGDNHASPDEIPGREETDDREMIADITDLLRRQSTPDLNLVDLFKSILRGEGTRIQRQTFGYDRADAGRKLIVQTIQRYANDTQNWHLLRLLDRFRDFSANRPDPGRKKVEKKPKSPRSTLSPEEADYRSIVQVLEKHDRSVSMMVLGKVRRRWLERKPRDPASPAPNRLLDVLRRMVQDGVLEKHGSRYVPGPNYAAYLDTAEPLAVA